MKDSLQILNARSDDDNNNTYRDLPLLASNAWTSLPLLLAQQLSNQQTSDNNLLAHLKQSRTTTNMDRLFSPSKKKHARKESGQFYFVPREPGVTSEVRDEDAVVELNTDHANDETYEPKPVNRSLSLVSACKCGGDEYYIVKKS